MSVCGNKFLDKHFPMQVNELYNSTQKFVL